MTSDKPLQTPSPIPQGMVPLSHCAGYLAVRLGDKRFIKPIAVYHNAELDEYRIEPPISDIFVYVDIIKFALLAGYINGCIDGTSNVLTPDFWQWPDSKDCLLSGEWQDSRLLVEWSELRQFVDVYLTQMRNEFDGLQDNNVSPDGVEEFVSDTDCDEAVRDQSFGNELNGAADTADIPRVDSTETYIDWLTRRMKADPMNPRPKREIRAAAEKELGVTVSDTGFKLAWRFAVRASGAKAWSRSGRRPGT